MTDKKENLTVYGIRRREFLKIVAAGAVASVSVVKDLSAFQPGQCTSVQCLSGGTLYACDPNTNCVFVYDVTYCHDYYTGVLCYSIVSNCRLTNILC